MPGSVLGAVYTLENKAGISLALEDFSLAWKINVKQTKIKLITILVMVMRRKYRVL